MGLTQNETVISGLLTCPRCGLAVRVFTTISMVDGDAPDGLALRTRDAKTIAEDHAPSCDGSVAALVRADEGTTDADPR